VKYVGAFYDTGKEFDSSWSRGPDETLPFGICQQGVIPGFAVGPTGLKVGGRRQIIIPSELGYGAQGSPPSIPGGAALVFVVDLVTVS
jgi:peptidylprolyl isomerase